MNEKTNEVLKTIFSNFTDEQKAKAEACNNGEELVNLLGEWDIELPDELVDQVTGGNTIDRIKEYFGINPDF